MYTKKTCKEQITSVFTPRKRGEAPKQMNKSWFDDT